VYLHLRKLRAHYGGNEAELYFKVPTLLWFVNEADIDYFLYQIELCGAALSLIPALSGRANMLIMFSVWILYQAVTNVGQVWYSFGWEAQLLETGFLAIFLVPFLYAKDYKTPILIVWLYRWLVLRIYLGAGLIKIRGDQCWRDLTCMMFHYETTCVPNPISWFMHQLPEEWHMMEVVFNHVIQLCVPWLLLLPRQLRHIGALGVMLEMQLIVSTGNYGFLNHLTMAPAIFCFDDKAFAWLGTTVTSIFERPSKRKKQKKSVQVEKKEGWSFRQLLNVFVTLVVVYMSGPVVLNLLSGKFVRYFRIVFTSTNALMFKSPK